MPNLQSDYRISSVLPQETNSLNKIRIEKKASHKRVATIKLQTYKIDAITIIKSRFFTHKNFHLISIMR
jgi:hypothetical protein